MPAPYVGPEILACLPPVLRAIVRALGIARAREWLMTYGGRNACIPLTCAAQGLKQEEVARLRHALVRHMDTAGRVTIPKADKILTYFRDVQIRRERNQASLAMLALRYGLTTRHIQNICREEDDTRQGSLNLF
jgi:hypothetical protein